MTPADRDQYPYGIARRRTRLIAALIALCPAALLAAEADLRQAVSGYPLVFEPNVGQADPSTQYLAHGPGYALTLGQGGASLALGSETLKLRIEGAAERSQPQPEEPLAARVNYYIGSNPARWRAGIETFGKVRYPEVYPGIDLLYYGTQGRLEYDFDVAAGADARAIRLDFQGARRLTLDARGNLHVATLEHEVIFKQPVAYQRNDQRRVAARYRVHGHVARFEIGAHDRNQALVIDPVLSYFSYLGGSQTDVIGLNSPQVGSAAGQAAAVDGAGDLLVTGYTSSTNFPTQAPFAPPATKSGGTWVFVSKFAANGGTLVYSTYLGGTSGEDQGAGIAVDAVGNAFVTGTTNSLAFPATAGAYQTVCSPNFVNSGTTAKDGCAGATSAFISKFSPSGALLASTFLGSTYGSSGSAIAVDSSGRPYVAGSALPGVNVPLAPFQNMQVAFPTTAGAVQTAYAYAQGELYPGQDDAFLAVFDPTLSTLLYSTLFGDNRAPEQTNGDYAWTHGAAVTVDSAGNAYLAGNTIDLFLSVTQGAFETNPASCGEVTNSYYLAGSCPFIAKFSPLGSSSGMQLSYATYLGGAPTGGYAQQFVTAIVADGSGDLYVTGQTDQAGFPTTPGAYQRTCDGFDTATNTGNSNCNALFLAELNPAGTALLASTYYGCVTCSGDSIQNVSGLVRDASGNLYVAGTAADGLAVAYGLDGQNPNCGCSPFVAEFDPTLSVVKFSTLLDVGNAGQISTAGLAIDATGAIYLAGNTNAPETSAATSGALQAAFGGGSSDGFVAKILILPYYASGQLVIPTITVGAVTYSDVVVTVAGIASGPSGTSPSGSSVTYNTSNHEITIPEGSVGNSLYYNVVVNPSALVSIGSVTGADTYDGTTLHVPSVQVVGGAIYSNVTATVTAIESVRGGLPAAARDQYTPATRTLFIPVVQYNGKVYTNVTVTVTPSG